MSRSPHAAKRRKKKKTKKKVKLMSNLFTEIDFQQSEAHKEVMKMANELLKKHNEEDARMRAKAFPYSSFAEPGRIVSGTAVHNRMEEEVLKSYSRTWATSARMSAQNVNRVVSHQEPEPAASIAVEEVSVATEEASKRDFHKGDRVYLEDEEGRYGPTPSNPTKGTEFECPGTITAIGGHHYCEVRWDNGRTNTYDAVKDLVLAMDMINCKSIW